MRLFGRRNRRADARDRGRQAASQSDTLATELEELAALEIAYARKPGDETSAIKFAQSLVEFGGARRAREVLQPLIASKDAHPWAMATMARCAQAEGDFETARLWWAKVREAEPGNRAAEVNLGVLAADAGDYASLSGPMGDLERDAATAGAWLSLPRVAEAAARNPDDLNLEGRRRFLLNSRYNMRPFDNPEDVDPGRQARKEAQNEIRMARRLALAGDLTRALDILPLTALTDDCAMVREQRSAILSQRGDARAAAREAIAAFRASPSPSATEILCATLFALGRRAICDRLLDYASERAEESAIWRRTLSTLSATVGDFAAALRHARIAVETAPTSYETHQVLALALWLNADEATWRTSLAVALDRPEIANADQSERAIEDYMAEVEATAKDAAADDLIRLRALVASPWSLKLERPLTKEEGRAIRAIRDATPEAMADAAAAEALAETAIRFAERYPNPAKTGHLLRRLAAVAEAGGQLAVARRLLERVCWLEKQNGMNLGMLAAFLRRRAPRLTLTGEGPRIAALMVTCDPNRERADVVARSFHERSGLTVVTLSANETLGAPTLEAAPYGHHLTVPGDDQYLGLAQKLNAAYRYLAWCSNVTGALKVDDDVVIGSEGLFAMTRDRLATRGEDYVGVRSQFRNSVFHNGRHTDQHELRFAHHTPRVYADGANGYFVSRRSLEAIARLGVSYFADWRNDAIYEDVFFGEILAAEGVELTHYNMKVFGGLVADVFEAPALLKRLRATLGEAAAARRNENDD